LSAAEVRHRIECCWRPYRETLARTLTEAAACHGARWHLNLHSMPSNAYERLGLQPSGPLADVVLGDLHGTSCDPGFVALVADAFRQRGYAVAINEPYAGRDLLHTFGAPHRGHHSLQIEINRAIYMNETSREPLPQASSVKADLHGVLTTIARHIRSTTATTSPTFTKETP
jgi:N-formylglutamate deformylase